MKKETKVVLTPEGYLELEAELNDLKPEEPLKAGKCFFVYIYVIS